jgi:hypothetical protein
MAAIRFVDVQSRPIEFLDSTSLTPDEFEQLIEPFEEGAFGDSYTPGETSIIGKNALPPIGKGSPWDKLRLSR